MSFTLNFQSCVECVSIFVLIKNKISKSLDLYEDSKGLIVNMIHYRTVLVKVDHTLFY